MREPFVAQIADLLAKEIDRTGHVPDNDHFLFRVVMPTMPDATIGEVRAAVLRYMSTIPANDEGADQ